MEKLFFCSRWGSEHLPWPDFLKKVKAAGYDGVETSLPTDPKAEEDMANGLSKFSLKLIAVHWDTVTPDFNLHQQELEQRLSALTALKPLFITSHTGKDHFSFEQNVALLSHAEQISGSTGIPVLHETHRGKFSFAAHLTKAYLEQLPWLKLTLDISHWFTVAESYLEDQAEAVNLALSRTGHIHSRVGFTQGPQVNDPRDIKWQEALEQHLKQWDKVLQLQKEKGTKQFTFTSEFGPFPYMASKPEGVSAAKHQWDINNYMKDLLKSRYYAD
jgi:sugar phosphate isomerase/epimerase